MQVSVAYALAHQQWWIDVEVSEGTTLISAVHKSGVLDIAPEIELESQKVGVFGKIVPLDTLLADGDRIEIYRPITWKAPDEDDDDDDD